MLSSIESRSKRVISWFLFLLLFLPFPLPIPKHINHPLVWNLKRKRKDNGTDFHYAYTLYLFSGIPFRYLSRVPSRLSLRPPKRFIGGLYSTTHVSIHSFISIRLLMVNLATNVTIKVFSLSFSTFLLLTVCVVGLTSVILANFTSSENRAYSLSCASAGEYDIFIVAMVRTHIRVDFNNQQRWLPTDRSRSLDSNNTAAAATMSESVAGTGETITTTTTATGGLVTDTTKIRFQYQPKRLQVLLKWEKR